MRGILAAVLMGLALWQAVVDWQATIDAGYAYRLTPIDQVLTGLAPGPAGSVLGAWRGTSIPWLWDPIGATMMALPMALVLAGLAALLWVTRRRR